MTSPTLFSVSSYPLRMIAAEWMAYLEVMDHSIKQYEYSPNTCPAALEQIAALNGDIYTLQQWTRRSTSSADKIRYTIRFLKYHRTEDDDALVTGDYEHIAFGIDTYSRRLEALVSIATSLIQAIDSRRSLTETRNISRLTYLALSFIPLTFVSGLFSMNNTIESGGQGFGLYFAVSIPLCIPVFLIVHPSDPGVIAVRIWRSRAIQKYVV